jgi:hypothetical protein
MTADMHIAHDDYTPNRARSIEIDGPINRSLFDRLRPRILHLTSSSREPVTIYLDSPGGVIGISESILALLRSPNKDGERCWLIAGSVGTECESLKLASFAEGEQEDFDSSLSLPLPTPKPIPTPTPTPVTIAS